MELITICVMFLNGLIDHNEFYTVGAMRNFNREGVSLNLEDLSCGFAAMLLLGLLYYFGYQGGATTLPVHFKL